MILSDIDKGGIISRGQRLCFPAGQPYEEFVEWMLFETLDREYPLGFIVISGHKAGLIAQYLPIEARMGTWAAISADWLKENWTSYGWDRCSPDSVRVFNAFEVAE